MVTNQEYCGRFFRLGLIMLGLSGASFSAFGATTTFNDEILDGAPTFHRPVSGNPPGALVNATGNTGIHRYLARSFTVNATGSYTINYNSTGASAHPDPFLCIYSPSFNPASPLTNVLQCHDDISGGNKNSTITRTYNSGTTYIAVFTGSQNNDKGTFTATAIGNAPANGTLTFGEPPIDFGDAPASYSTLLANNGARHRTGPLFLGALVDSEADGQPHADALGDDNTDVPDDEDGVSFVGDLRIGETDNSIQVTSSQAGKLNVWIDFNANGNWGDPGERVITNTPISSGTATLQFAIPISATAGDTFVRVRLSSADLSGFTGEALDGEVEDYKVTLVVAAPAMSVSPDPLIFNARSVGTSSSASTVTIDNTGNANLDIASVQLTGGNSGDFAFESDSDTCSGMAVAPEDACSVNVIFTPTAPGDRTTTFRVNSNAATHPDDVVVSGTGIQQAISVTPPALSFGSQSVNTTSASQQVTVSNPGTDTLTIETLNVTANFAYNGGSCGSNLEAGSSCTIGVTFTPTATGSHSGTLTIASNAPSPNHLVNVSLSGTGTALTKLTADAYITAKTGTLNQSEIIFRATLVDNATQAPIASKTINFSANGQPICSALTNAQGVASCAELVSGTVNTVAGLSYKADFAAVGPYSSSTANAPVARVGNTP